MAFVRVDGAERRPETCGHFRWLGSSQATLGWALYQPAPNYLNNTRQLPGRRGVRWPAAAAPRKPILVGLLTPNFPLFMNAQAARAGRLLLSTPPAPVLPLLLLHRRRRRARRQHQL